MIRNDAEWARADITIRRYKSKVDALHRRRAGPAQVVAEAELARLESRIVELQAQKRTYEELQQRLRLVECPLVLHQVPELLIARRIKTGMSQKQLASAIGIHPRSFARYEATAYASAPFRHVLQVDNVLKQIEHDQVACLHP